MPRAAAGPRPQAAAAARTPITDHDIACQRGQQRHHAPAIPTTPPWRHTHQHGQAKGLDEANRLCVPLQGQAEHAQAVANQRVSACRQAEGGGVAAWEGALGGAGKLLQLPVQ